MPSTANVRDYGARGAAVKRGRVRLTTDGYRDYRYQRGIEFDVYGAQGDALDSPGIQQAIDAVAQAGGGTVYVPPGAYLIAPIRLRDNVRLHLEAGAVLYGTTDLEHYRDPAAPAADTLAERRAAPTDGDSVFRRLISAVDAVNVSLTGAGEINAQSPAFFVPHLNADLKTPLRRPREMLLFRNCRNLALRDVTIRNSVNWTLHLLECDGVLVDGVKMHHFDGPNADGIDVSACSNVTISNCRLWVTDDAICLKNLAPEVTMRNIAVTNCVIRTLCNAVKIGTETVGDVENVVVGNLVVHSPEGDVRAPPCGVHLSSMDGGHIRRILIHDLVLERCQCPVFLCQGKRTKLQAAVREPRAGSIADVTVANVTAEGAARPCFVNGLAESPIRNVLIRDLAFTSPRMPAGPVASRDLPEDPEAYPHDHRFGPLPAYLLYCRHAEHVRVRNASVWPRPTLQREPVVFADCRNCSATTDL